MIGGAAINRRFGRRILQTDDNEFYRAGVFYCKTPSKRLIHHGYAARQQKRVTFIEQIRRESQMELERAAQAETPRAAQSLAP